MLVIGNKKLLAAVVLLVYLLSSACALTKPQRELISGDNIFVLEGATLIDGTGSGPQLNSVVVIKGERIFRVGKVGDFRYDVGVTVENLSDKYILPGFIDVHVHPRLGAEVDTMRLLLEFGITSIRIPGVGFDAHDTLGIELRNKIENGSIVGPRIITGAKIIEGPVKTFPDDIEVHSVDEIRSEVRRQAELGVDLVKLYWNTPPSFISAAIEEADELGIQVLGHLRASSWTEAASLGIDGLVHSAGDGPTWELLPPEERDNLRSLKFPEYYYRFLEAIDLEVPWFDSLVDVLVENKVTVDPTLVIMQSLYFGDDLGVLTHLEPELMPKSVLATWGEGWEEVNPVTVNNPQALTDAKGMFAVGQEIVRRFHERGVQLAVGTDVGMPWITPGVSFHREMELLVDSGIAIEEVLVMATRNGAEAMRVDAERGTIIPGKLADLVVLSDSPLEEISNTRSIEAVYKGGNKFNPNNLHSEVP